jgi:putative membrane protein
MDRLRIRQSLWVLIGAQALAFAALAQTQDAVPPKQPMPDRTMPADSATDRNTMPAPDSTTMKTVTPQAFASQAAVIGKAEIELGQLAMEKSQDESVRKYAQQMVKDHTAADAKLKKIAAQKNLSLPQTLDANHQAVKQKLSGLQGEAFDREYAKEMAKGHDKAVALFESASQTPQMPAELKEFAAATLPTLEKHKDMAHTLHEKEGA